MAKIIKSKLSKTIKSIGKLLLIVLYFNLNMITGHEIDSEKAYRCYEALDENKSQVNANGMHSVSQASVKIACA